MAYCLLLLLYIDAPMGICYVEIKFTEKFDYHHIILIIVLLLMLLSSQYGHIYDDIYCYIMYGCTYGYMLCRNKITVLRSLMIIIISLIIVILMLISVWMYS
jgi:hypothetical protein